MEDCRALSDEELLAAAGGTGSSGRDMKISIRAELGDSTEKIREKVKKAGGFGPEDQELQNQITDQILFQMLKRGAGTYEARWTGSGTVTVSKTL